jgi:hypothetical protein
LRLKAHYPDLEVVRRVNSRAFMLDLERRISGDSACRATLCASRQAVQDWLSQAAPGRYLAKGNHGLAGIGQMRFALDQSGESLPREQVAAPLKRLADRHGGVVIEEELGVVREWGVLFRVAPDGRRSAVQRHRLLSGATGGYLGCLVLPGSQAEGEGEWASHHDTAERTVDAVAAALHHEGYFGPVGLDMFLHSHGEQLRFRPLVDLNARQSMAWPAHGLAARFADRAVLFRQFPAKSIRIPDHYAALDDLISFDRRAHRGAIWITPLLPLTRVSVAFVGHDEADVLALHQEFLRFVSRERDSTVADS